MNLCFLSLQHFFWDEHGWSHSFVEKSDSRGHGHIYVICADDRLLPGDLDFTRKICGF